MPKRSLQVVGITQNSGTVVCQMENRTGREQFADDRMIFARRIIDQPRADRAPPAGDGGLLLDGNGNALHRSSVSLITSPHFPGLLQGPVMEDRGRRVDGSRKAPSPARAVCRSSLRDRGCLGIAAPDLDCGLIGDRIGHLRWTLERDVDDAQARRAHRPGTRSRESVVGSALPLVHLHIAAQGRGLRLRRRRNPPACRSRRSRLPTSG